MYYSHQIHLRNMLVNLVTDGNKRKVIFLLLSPLVLFHQQTDYIYIYMFKTVFLLNQPGARWFWVSRRPTWFGCGRVVDSPADSVCSNLVSRGPLMAALYPGVPALLKPLISQSADCALIICEVMELRCSCPRRTGCRCSVLRL